MRIDQSIKFSKEIRGSSLGAFNADAVSISTTTLNAVPTTVSASFVQAEVQAIADAVAEISKTVTG